MKKAPLLCLGTLACLTLAGLYAYAWFMRDPLAAAYDRIGEGITAGGSRGDHVECRRKETIRHGSGLIVIR